jgi:hypothetical protein
MQDELYLLEVLPPPIGQILLRNAHTALNELLLEVHLPLERSVVPLIVGGVELTDILVPGSHASMPARGVDIGEIVDGCFLLMLILVLQEVLEQHALLLQVYALLVVRKKALPLLGLLLQTCQPNVRVFLCNYRCLRSQLGLQQEPLVEFRLPLALLQDTTDAPPHCLLLSLSLLLRKVLVGLLGIGEDLPEEPLVPLLLKNGRTLSIRLPFGRGRRLELQGTLR